MQNEHEDIANSDAVKSIESGAVSPKRSFLKYWQIGLVAFVVVAALIALYFLFFEDSSLKGFFSLVWSLLLPFIAGGCIAFILKPIVQFFEKILHKPFAKMKNRHQAHVIATGLATAITIILTLLLLALIVWMIVPQLITNIHDLITGMPDLVDNAFLDVESKTASHASVCEHVKEWHAQANYYLTGNGTDSIVPVLTKWFSNFVEENSDDIVSTVSSGVFGLFSTVMNVLVAFISCIYLLNSRKKLAAQGKIILFALFPNKGANAILEEFKFIDHTFTNFIRGRLVEASIIGILCYIGMRIFRLPYAELISVFVGIANIIPFFGPFIGAVPSALLLLVTGWSNCLIFLILIIVIGQLDGNLIGPKVMGAATGIDSFWVLFAMSFFGGLWGFVGMLIGIPVFAVLYDIFRKFILRCLKKRHNYGMYEAYALDQEKKATAKAEHKEAKKKRIKNTIRTIRDNVKHN